MTHIQTCCATGVICIPGEESEVWKEIVVRKVRSAVCSKDLLVSPHKPRRSFLVASSPLLQHCHHTYLETKQRDLTMEHSPLSRLPPELRNLIYKYAVVQENGIKIGAFDHPRTRSLLLFEVNPAAPSKNATLALAKVCRKLHEETIGLYYAENRFIFTTSGQGPLVLKMFLESINKDQRKLLTHLKFRAPQVTLSIASDRAFREWEAAALNILSYQDGVLPGPVSIRGRFQFRDGPRRDKANSFEVVVDMSRLQESMEKNRQAVKALQQQMTEQRDAAMLGRLMFPMKMFVSKVDPKYKGKRPEWESDDSD